MLTRRRFLYLFPAAASSVASAQDLASSLPQEEARSPRRRPRLLRHRHRQRHQQGHLQSRFDPAPANSALPCSPPTTPAPPFSPSRPPAEGRRSSTPSTPSTSLRHHHLLRHRPQDGALQQIGQVPSVGAGPAYVSRRHHRPGGLRRQLLWRTVATYRVHPDGTLSANL